MFARCLPACVPPSTSTWHTDDVKEYVRLLQELGCKVAAFDMDNTLVGAHSRGRMTKARVQEDFVAHVSRDFVRVVPAMRVAGIKMAVATWADRVKYRRDVRACPHTRTACPSHTRGA